MKDEETQQRIAALEFDIRFLRDQLQDLRDRFNALLTWIGVQTEYREAGYEIKEEPVAKALVDEAIENTRDFRRKHR